MIVPTCGFDCIPADILVYLSNRTLKKYLGPDADLGLSQTFYSVEGGMSGGTVATLLSDIEQVPRLRYEEGQKDYALSLGTYLPVYATATVGGRRRLTSKMQCQGTRVRAPHWQRACRSRRPPSMAGTGSKGVRTAALYSARLGSLIYSRRMRTYYWTRRTRSRKREPSAR